MSLLLRLAVGGGRAALARLVLVVLGTAMASALLLVAAGVLGLDRADLSLGGGSGSVTAADGTVQFFDDPGSTGPISNSYLVEAELRRGVAIGFVLCVVPLLVFVATASRVAARQREQRLAGLRLAGATDRQVRGLAAVDTAVGTGLGVLLGGLLFVVVRRVLMTGPEQELRDIAARAAPSLPAAVGVLLGLVLLLTAASALALRSVVITPLAVSRKAPRRHPRPWGLLLLLGGLGCFALVLASGVDDGGAVVLGLCLAAAMLGLITCGPWLTSLTGRVVGRLARGPALLLAGRRLEDEPRAQARAMSAITLVVLSATIALVVLEDFRRSVVADMEGVVVEQGLDRFAVQGFSLAALGIAFSLVVGAAGLLLVTVEGLLERRRTLASLVAQGVPMATLRLSVLAQVGVAMLPAAVLAIGTGLAAISALYGGEHPGVPATIALLPPAAVLVAMVAVATTLPWLRRTADLEQLRTP